MKKIYTICLMFFVISLSTNGFAKESAILIKNVNVFDGVNEEMINNAKVLSSAYIIISAHSLKIGLKEK
jgi:hypothetical protein